jgi:hypothetical protein
MASYHKTQVASKDTTVPLDRLEACVRGLEPWRGSEMFEEAPRDGVVQS